MAARSTTPAGNLALAVARRHPAAVNPQLLESVDRDQWSVTRPVRSAAAAVSDRAWRRRGHQSLRLRARSGEIVLDTNRTERVWNWLGSIPHWIYPTVLRQDGALWRSVVLWMSGICMIVAVSGIWIGILRVRLRRRYSSGSVSPYRGWMKWHHVHRAGVGRGRPDLDVLGLVVAGSRPAVRGRATPSREMMQRYVGHDAPTFVAAIVAPRGAAVEARFVWLGGTPEMLLIDRQGKPDAGRSRQRRRNGAAQGAHP